MQKRFQVFVSSTYSDLAVEREKVIHALNKIGLIAVGMEQFPSTGESQMSYIEKIIDESDYYIVIVRGKYGSTGADGISFTEKEFNYATSKNIPCLAFLYADLDSLPRKEMDHDVDRTKLLLAFRSMLESNRIVSYWSSVDDLIMKVKDSLNETIRRAPGVGYIRGDKALDLSVIIERDRLKAELDQLKKEQQLSTSSNSNNSNNQIDEIASIKFIIDPGRSISPISMTLTRTFDLKITWRSLFILCYDVLEREQLEPRIIDGLLRSIRDSKNASAAYPKIAIDGNTLRETERYIRLNLVRLGLVTASLDQDLVPQFRWQITSLGMEVICDAYAK